MNYFVVDIEADGPVPPIYSMVSFGAVLVDPDRKLTKTFYGKVAPISGRYKEDALAISNTTRKMHLTYDNPAVVMQKFYDWVKANSRGKAVFMTDNLSLDWSFMNYYFHKYVGENPFGWSGRRIGDLYCGMMRDPVARWKHLRTTVSDHHPVNDAKANAEVLYKLQDMGLDLKF